MSVLIATLMVESPVLPGRAGPQISNPGFETGDFTAWSPYGEPAGVVSTLPQDGSFHASLSLPTGTAFQQAGVYQPRWPPPTPARRRTPKPNDTCGCPSTGLPATTTLFSLVLMGLVARRRREATLG